MGKRRGMITVSTRCVRSPLSVEQCRRRLFAAVEHSRKYEVLERNNNWIRYVPADHHGFLMNKTVHVEASDHDEGPTVMRAPIPEATLSIRERAGGCEVVCVVRCPYAVVVGPVAILCFVASLCAIGIWGIWTERQKHGPGVGLPGLWGLIFLICGAAALQAAVSLRMWRQLRSLKRPLAAIREPQRIAVGDE